MTTKATKDLPEIEWEQGKDYEAHDHMRIYGCSGVSADGREWIGDWEEVDGQFSDITHIEEA